MAFSLDGTILATGGQDNLVRLWDVDHRTELARLSGHSQLVEAIAFSPDGKWLVSVSGNYRMPEQSGEIRVWDIEGTSTRAVQSFLPATGPLTGLSFSPRGKTFATSGGDGAVHVWAFDPKLPNESQTAQRLWPRVAIRPKARDAVTSLVASPDGKLIAAGTRGAVSLYQPGVGFQDFGVVPAAVRELRDARLDGNGLGSAIMKVAISSDGKLLATSSASGISMIWDIHSGKELAHLTRPYVTTFPIAFTPRGAQLLVTWRDNYIHSWNFLTSESKPLFSQYRPGGLEISPDGKLLAVFGEGDPSGRVTLLNAETGDEVGSLVQPGVPAEVTCLRFTPDGKTLVVANRQRLNDTGNGQDGQNMTEKDLESLNNTEFALLALRGKGHDGQEIPQDALESDYLNVWDLAIKTKRSGRRWNQPILDIAISPDGNHLAVVGGKPGESGYKNNAILWSNWKPSQPGEGTLRSLDGHGDIVRAVAFFDGGREVVTACDDGLIRFWKVSTAKSTK
jgi:WD40 repeat protein